MPTLHRALFIRLILAFLAAFGAAAQDAPTEKKASPRPAFPKPHVNAPLGEIKAFPGDGSGAYANGRYRDLFAEQGHSPAETSAKIEKAFHQFFHGDGQEERVYFETGANENGPLAYITDWANNDARSEGMSYGMMIAVQLDKKREFDAIWNWANTYMLTTDPKNPSVGYFAWSLNTDGTPRATGAAPDGEEYFVMALYFASHRWGDGKGIYNYRAEADKLLRLMRHHPVLTANGPFRVRPEDPPFIQPNRPWPSPNNAARLKELAAKGGPPPAPRAPAPWEARAISIGPMVDEEHYMIRFVPNVDMTFTDPSYHLPAFYELWARWGPREDREFWAKAADVSRDLFHKVTGPATGLTQDTAYFDETPMIGFNGQPAAFGYDSWRSISNWAVDYSWWRKDGSQTALTDKLQAFLHGQGLSTFADRYTLDGKPLSNRHSVGMLAAAAVGSLAASDGTVSKAFVEELWNTPMPSGEQRYFDGMLYLFSMLHASGSFRIIEPRRR
ncbi:MAG: glycoside hydrolase [Acidobacteria bacterium]|nr:glycoside hydrolase [Acidobacteriota bacterium]